LRYATVNRDEKMLARTGRCSFVEVERVPRPQVPAGKRAPPARLKVEAANP